MLRLGMANYGSPIPDRDTIPERLCSITVENANSLNRSGYGGLRKILYSPNRTKGITLMSDQRSCIKFDFVPLVAFLLFFATLTTIFLYFTPPAQAAEPGPVSLSRSSGVSASEHPEERLRAIRSAAPAHRRVLRQVPPGEMDAANPPRWTETLAAPTPPTQAPKPNVRPDVWVDPRRN